MNFANVFKVLIKYLISMTGIDYVDIVDNHVTVLHFPAPVLDGTDGVRDDP